MFGLSQREKDQRNYDKAHKERLKEYREDVQLAKRQKDLERRQRKSDLRNAEIQRKTQSLKVEREYYRTKEARRQAKSDASVLSRLPRFGAPKIKKKKQGRSINGQRKIGIF